MKCPECGKKMISKKEALKKLNKQLTSVGDTFNLGYIRTLDSWSVISYKCPYCYFVK